MFGRIGSPFLLRIIRPLQHTSACLAVMGLALFLLSCGGGGVTQPPPVAPGFTVSVQAPSVPIQQQGASQQQTISVTGTNGFTGTVSVSFQNLPTGINITPPGPYSISAGGSQSISISASSAAAVGSATLTLTGTSGTLSSTASFSVMVSAAPSFQLSVQAPSISIQQQGIAQGQTLSVLPVNGFTGTVTVSFQNLPAGIIVAPPGPYAIAAGVSQSITVSASSSAAVGSATLALIGTSGSTTNSTSFGITVTAAAIFQLTAVPPSISLTPGSTGHFQIQVTSSTNPVPAVVYEIPTIRNTGFSADLDRTQQQPNTQGITVEAGPFAQPVVNFPLTISASQLTNVGSTSIVTVSITITNTPAATSSPTRSTIIRTDMPPTGAFYDQTRKLLFVTVRQLNEVLVYSTVDDGLRATLSIDQPQGIDESVDGKEVYVGTLTPNFAVIDPDLLQVTQLLPGPTSPNPSFTGEFLYPATLAALSNGKVLFEVTDGLSLGIEGALYVWDPNSGIFTPIVITPGPDGLILSHSADRSKVLLGSQNAPTSLALYDVATNSVKVSAAIEQVGAAPAAAAVSPNGSQVAFPSGPNVLIFDASFNQTASIPLNFGDIRPPQIAYSLDGKFIYVLSGADGLSAFSVLDAAKFTVLGAAPSTITQLLAVDETGMIFGGAERILEFTDASSPSGVHLPVPDFLFSLAPTLLNPATPTQSVLTDSNLSASDQYQFFFGAPPASPNSLQITQFSVAPPNSIQLTAPVSSSRGAANVTFSRNDGWNAVSPDAVSYGPQILRLTFNAGPASGGTQVEIYGYGFLSASTTVTIGGSQATVTQVAGPGFISPFPFPMDRITLTTPAGAAGPADVTVTTPSGSTTLSGGFQYLKQAQVFPVPGILVQMVYDRPRQRIYASNFAFNRIEVFSVSSMSFLTPIPVGAQPSGISLTPDGSRLAVINSAAGTVSVVNPDTQTTLAVYPVLTPTDNGSLCQGQPITITSAGTHGMFVDINCTAIISKGSLHFLDLNTGSLSCAGIPFCDASGLNIVLPNSTGLWAMASSSGGNKVLIGDAIGDIQAIFDLNASTVVSTAMALNLGPGFSPTVNADVTRFATNFGIYDAQLNTISFPQDIDYLDAGIETADLASGQKLSPSGSLLFVPQFNEDPFPSSVDVYDVYRGRILMRIAIPDPIPGSLDSLAIDETGSKVFLITNTGISILQIAQLPLSVASVANPVAAVGDQVTIRGSGFKTGATVMFGTAIASATVVDANTITATVPSLSSGPCRIIVKNLDGNQYSIDLAFSVR